MGLYSPENSTTQLIYKAQQRDNTISKVSLYEEYRNRTVCLYIVHKCGYVHKLDAYSMASLMLKLELYIDPWRQYVQDSL